MNLYFIRHGDPDYDADCLTELGHTQAQILCERVKNFKLDAIFHSPMGRAKQTAEYCNKYYNFKMVELPWLREIEWGDLKGDIYSSDGPWNITEEMIKTVHAYPQGDSWKTDPHIAHDRLAGDVELREKQFDDFLLQHGYERQGQLYRIVKENNTNIALVCHGGLTSTLVSHLLNIPFWTYIAHFPMEVTAVTKICIKGKTGDYTAAEVDYINSYVHLSDC